MGPIFENFKKKQSLVPLEGEALEKRFGPSLGRVSACFFHSLPNYNAHRVLRKGTGGGGVHAISSPRRTVLKRGL